MAEGRSHNGDETVPAGAGDDRPDTGLPGKLLRIGELARRSGKTVRALHLYEEMDLLQPAHRSPGGFRLYHPSAVERVEWIAKLQDAGFSLTQLQDFLRTVSHESVASDAMARVREVFETKLRETREARARLQKLETDLEAALSYLDGCKGCPTTNHTNECPDCHVGGHAGQRPPTLVAGIHQT